MLKRSFGSKDRVGKLVKPQKRSFRDHIKQKMFESVDSPMKVKSNSPVLASAIITVVVGQEQRLFAAHEDVLSHAPMLASALEDKFFDGKERRIYLPDEEPEIFSCVLEYLYKGDYSPFLLHDKRRNTWVLEGDVESPKMGGRGMRIRQRQFITLALTMSFCETLPFTVPLIVMASTSSSACHCASRACRVESRWRRSCAVLGTHMTTLRTRIRGCALIT